ncbi:hypothetical protein ACFWAR_08325 [Streptomyces sp. NPDC059917]|uniref:hypothetical protein n=1 Tax=Streptomyces sp. NPDC059917 TaxID=3347002 RepID=UPI00365D97EA
MRLRTTAAATFIGALALVVPAAGQALANDDGYHHSLGELHYKIEGDGWETIRPPENDTCYRLTGTDWNDAATRVKNETRSLALLFEDRSCGGRAERVLNPWDSVNGVEVRSVLFKPADDDDDHHGGHGRWDDDDDRHHQRRDGDADGRHEQGARDEQSRMEDDGPEQAGPDEDVFIGDETDPDLNQRQDEGQRQDENQRQDEGQRQDENQRQDEGQRQDENQAPDQNQGPDENQRPEQNQAPDENQRPDENQGPDQAQGPREDEGRRAQQAPQSYRGDRIAAKADDDSDDHLIHDDGLGFFEDGFLGHSG